MAKTYEHGAVRFDYPENWTLEEESDGGQQMATVYSPGGGFWSLSIARREVDPQSLVETAVQVLREEYDEVDAEAVDVVIGEQPTIGYDVNFYCLDLTNTTLIRSFRSAAATCLVIAQAEDREFDKIAPVFDAMLHSLAK